MRYVHHIYIGILNKDYYHFTQFCKFQQLTEPVVVACFWPVGCYYVSYKEACGVSR